MIVTIGEAGLVLGAACFAVFWTVDRLAPKGLREKGALEPSRPENRALRFVREEMGRNTLRKPDRTFVATNTASCSKKQGRLSDFRQRP